MKRLVFAYRYGALGGVTTQLLARLETFTSAFDVRLLFERDYGALGVFPEGTVTVAPTFVDQIDAIAELKPDLFVAVDSGWREPWIRAGSPGKLIVEVHTTTTNLTFLDELRAAQRIDLIIVASTYLKTLLEGRGIAEIAPVEVVPNCLASWWAEPAATWKAPAPMLLWIGRLEPHKGFDAFMDMCDSLEDIDYVPTVIGGTTDTNDEVLSACSRLFGSSRAHAPLWLPRVAYSSMPRVYASTAASGGALVITSALENFPMTVAEATMQGCPVVGPAVGGLPELLPEQSLYSGDPAPLARRVLTERGFGATIAAGAKRIIEPLVSPDRALRAYLAALERAL